MRNNASRFLRNSSFKLPSHHTLLLLIWTVGFVVIIAWQKAAVDSIWCNHPPTYRPIPRLRAHVFNLTSFGAVGDGITVNTKAFERAVSEIRCRGGGQLNVLPGRWLTAPFNLTSHITLFLAQNAVILGIDDIMGPLMGKVRHGGLSTVKKCEPHEGPLVQLIWSKDIHISEVTLRDSPFWTLHPYDCQNVTIRNVTILAPLSDAPNTDGIEPDSCENMLIEHCYISVGDDGIAIKSGWDQYGIAYARPSINILIRNVIVRSMIRCTILMLMICEVLQGTCSYVLTEDDVCRIQCANSAGVSIGSEMSGGVSKVTIENLYVWNSKRGIRIKTSAGRGGYVREISYRNLTLDNVRVGIVIKTDYNEHPDEGYDPNALPVIEDINFDGIRGQGVRIPARIYGSQEIPEQKVTFRDMLVGITYKKKRIFQCTFVQGRVIGKIFPSPCDNLDVYDEEGHLIRRATSQNSTTDVDYDS